MNRRDFLAGLAATATVGACGQADRARPLALLTWQPPDPAHLWGFAFLGVVGGSAAFLIIVAYRHAPASVIAPFDYTALIWGALLGWIFWREEPAVTLWIGTGLIAAAGIYLVRHEAKTAR